MKTPKIDPNANAETIRAYVKIGKPDGVTEPMVIDHLKYMRAVQALEEADTLDKLKRLLVPIITRGHHPMPDRLVERLNRQINARYVLAQDQAKP